MNWQKKYRWARTWPGETGLDGKPLEDFAAYDGDQYAGRIRLDHESLKKGQWMWSGAYPKGWKGSPITPNNGFKPTAAEAAQTVEEYWDAMKKKIGLTDE
ncbi:hypothetical protein J2T08_003607 [Neorhizobium galegae]|uniref:hypothetical protein n=1 Tax=Neorhizobium galegae TaxID=399 RepID=UPI00277E0475|nr:hypothetical protein [Neorhizobium galegae]MDQ0135686.1 hypothetical protein [Neorhizobium galegae]